MKNVQNKMVTRWTYKTMQRKLECGLRNNYKQDDGAL